jgi:hypothetical protein
VNLLHHKYADNDKGFEARPVAAAINAARASEAFQSSFDPEQKLHHSSYRRNLASSIRCCSNSASDSNALPLIFFYFICREMLLLLLRLGLSHDRLGDNFIKRIASRD